MYRDVFRAGKNKCYCYCVHHVDTSKANTFVPLPASNRKHVTPRAGRASDHKFPREQKKHVDCACFLRRRSYPTLTTGELKSKFRKEWPSFSGRPRVELCFFGRIPGDGSRRSRSPQLDKSTLTDETHLWHRSTYFVRVSLSSDQKIASRCACLSALLRSARLMPYKYIPPHAKSKKKKKKKTLSCGRLALLDRNFQALNAASGLRLVFRAKVYNIEVRGLTRGTCCPTCGEPENNQSRPDNGRRFPDDWPPPDVSVGSHISTAAATAVVRHKCHAPIQQRAGCLIGWQAPRRCIRSQAMGEEIGWIAKLRLPPHAAEKDEHLAFVATFANVFPSAARVIAEATLPVTRRQNLAVYARQQCPTKTTRLTPERLPRVYTQKTFLGETTVDTKRRRRNRLMPKAASFHVPLYPPKKLP